MKNLKYFEAVAIIIGTVIGLGVFAIPYAGRLGGLIPGIALILAIAFLMVLISFLFAEIIIFSGKEKGLVFYADKYLGRWAGRVVTFSIFFGYTGSLVAYILAIVVFSSSLFGLNDDFFWPIILFFTAGNSLILVRGVRILGKLEAFFSFFMIVSFMVIFFAGISFWQPTSTNWAFFLLPYGVIWFALTGESAIPIAIRALKGDEKKIAPAILIAYLVIVLVTISFFVNAILIGDGRLKPDPFLTMSEQMGNWVIYLGSALSLVAVATSFWASATYLKKILITDLNIPAFVSWATVIFLPLFLIFIGVHNFIKVIGLIGVFMGTIDSLIIISIYHKIFRRKNVVPRVLPLKIPTPILWALSLLLLGAALSSLIFFS